MSRDWLTPGNILQAAGIAIIVALWVVDRAVPAGAGPPDLRDAVEALGALAPWLLALLLLGALVRALAANRQLRGGIDTIGEAVEEASERAKVVEVATVELLGLAQRVLQLEPGDAAGTGVQEAGAGGGRRWLDGWSEGAGRLLLEDSDLETAYGQARAALESKGLGGELTRFSLLFLPFRCPPLLHMTFEFVSAEAERKYRVEARLATEAAVPAFGVSLDARQARRAVQSDSVFRNLPWRAQPQWREMVRLAALRHGSLAAEPTCIVDVLSTPSERAPHWSVSVMDFGNRCLSVYEGTCPDDLKPCHDRVWLALGTPGDAA